MFLKWPHLREEVQDWELEVQSILLALFLGAEILVGRVLADVTVKAREGKLGVTNQPGHQDLHSFSTLSWEIKVSVKSALISSFPAQTVSSLISKAR